MSTGLARALSIKTYLVIRCAGVFDVLMLMFCSTQMPIVVQSAELKSSRPWEKVTLDSPALDSDQAEHPVTT